MKKLVEFFKGITVDKLLNFSIGFNLFILFHLFYISIFVNILICSILFVGKELYDKYYRKSTFDKYDLIADYSGMLLALILIIINNYIL